MNVTRRQFVQLGAMGATVSFFAPGLFTRSALGAGAPQRLLVILQLSGGNDAVNTFIPYSDSAYRTVRPTLAIADNQIIKLDDRLGFHPALARLKPLYDARKFAFVTNVGFPTLDRSHFRCMDVWHAGVENVSSGAAKGWLGRYADIYLGAGAQTLTNVAISSNNPSGYRADVVYPMAVPSATGFDVSVDFTADRTAFITALRSVYQQPQTAAELKVIRGQGEQTFAAIDLIKALPAVSATVTYPNSALGRAFAFAAQIAAGNVGSHAIWINTGGYDTHATQANTHTNLLTGVAESLAAFQDDLTARGIADQVIVMAFSEFGRRIAENGSAGTDHGKAGAMFLLGSKIKGGTFYGEVPSVSSGVNGDLATQIDFRAVYSTIIKDWFGRDPVPVFGASYANLGFVETQAIGCDPAYGDLNGDGAINSIDSVILANHLAGNVNPGSPPFNANGSYADVDGSGSVNVADSVVLNHYLAGNINCLPKK